MLKILKNILLRFDLFSCTASLRKGGETSHQTIIGGILSLILFFTFVGIFAGAFVSMLNKTQIYAQAIIEAETDLQDKIQNLQFAVGLKDIQMSSEEFFEYFNLQVSWDNATGIAVFINTQIKMGLCNVSDWTLLGDDYEKKFAKLKMGSKFCPLSSQNYLIFGAFGTPTFGDVIIQLQRCHGFSTCKSYNQIQGFIKQRMLNFHTIELQLLVINHKLNPKNQNPIKIELKQINLPFGLQSYGLAKMDLLKYKIQTDQSILPYQDISTVRAHSFQKLNKYTGQILGKDLLIQIYIFKSVNKALLKRKYKKIDQMLSYVGGLFSLLFGILAFFLLKFIQIRYEFYASEWAFVAKGENGKRITQQNLPFYKYPFYLMYDWLDSIGCAPKCCNRMQELHKVREQVNSQMDIRMLLNKLNYLDKVSNVLLNEHRQICLHLAGPPTIEQARQIRQVIELFDKTRQKQEERVINNQEQQMKNNIDFEQSHSQQFTRDIAMKNIISIMQPQNTEKETESERQLKLKVSKSLQRLINEKKNNVSDRIKVRIPQWIKASSKQPIQKEKPTLEMQQIEDNNIIYYPKQKNQMKSKDQMNFFKK